MAGEQEVKREVREMRESFSQEFFLAGKRCTLKGACTVCAVRRVMISLLQAGGTEEKFLGYWHSWRQKLKVTKHAR